MPSASDEQRAAWGGADGVGDDKAVAYLEERGYRESIGCWILPSPDHVITDEEGGALDFLVDEWDYGGIITEAEAPERAALAATRRGRPAATRVQAKALAFDLGVYNTGPTTLARLAMPRLLDPAPRWRPRYWRVRGGAWFSDRWIIRGQHSLCYTHWRALVPLYWLRAFLRG